MTDFDPSALPALCDTAIRDLAEARDIGQCLEIRNVMEAGRVYLRKHKAALEAQNACTRIVAMAEQKVGLELIAARQRGELAAQGHPLETSEDSDDLPVKLAEIGLTPQRAHMFRSMAALTNGEIEEVFEEAKAMGKPATKLALQRKAAEKVRKKRKPAIQPKPENITSFSLWLRRGAEIIPTFTDHREAMTLALRHRVILDSNTVRDLVQFLAALSAGMEADRAA